VITTRPTTLLLFLALCTPALAQEDTATVESGGPPNTEYAIPLQTARQDGADGSKSSDAKKHKTPLFGVGVHAPPPSQPATTTTTTTPAAASTPKPRPAKRPAHPRKKHPRHVRVRVSKPVAVLPVAVPASASSDGPSTSATIGGLAVAILLLGGVLGSIARRRRVS